MVRLARALELLVIFYFLEAGAFLVMAPWSRFWTDKVVGRSPLAVQPLLYSLHFRGFLLGLGLLHILFALRDFEAWRRNVAQQPAAAPETTGP